MRSPQESHAINRVLTSRGLPNLEEPGTIAQLAYIVEDHQHFLELLRACDPQLRREMYEAMKPHLRFPAHPLEDYMIAAKEYAASAELPVMEEDGTLRAYSPPEISRPVFELQVKCSRCDRTEVFLGERKADAIQRVRRASWAWDESAHARHYCPQCLED